MGGQCLERKTQWRVDFTGLAVLTGSIEVHWGAIKHEISLLSIVTGSLCWDEIVVTVTAARDKVAWLLGENHVGGMPNRVICLLANRVLLSTVDYRLTRWTGGHNWEQKERIDLSSSKAAAVKSIADDIKLSGNVRLFQIKLGDQGILLDSNNKLCFVNQRITSANLKQIWEEKESQNEWPPTSGILFCAPPAMASSSSSSSVK